MEADEHDIPDSTDWIGTPLAGLEAVEAALRCRVCKDFYNTPMLTSCNHTFCSVCIRRALSNEGKCPVCRAPDQELKLRSNWATEEVVQAFTLARPALITVARDPPARVPTAGPSSPKRRLEEGEGNDADDARRSSKRLRSSARASKSRGMEPTAEMARQEVDLTGEAESSPEPDDGLVACPVCSQRMKEAQVFTHLDQCTGDLPKKPVRSTPTPIRQNGYAIQTKPQSQLERLPAISYSMFKEGPLRKKLQELGISATGTKAMLEKRHKEWMTLWNANCDSLQPKKKSELLRELDSWERTQGAFASTSSKAANLGAQIRAKDFDGAAWASKHDDSFKDLIAQARKSKQKAQGPAKDTSEDNSTNVNRVTMPAAESVSSEVNGTHHREASSHSQHLSTMPIQTMQAHSQATTSSAVSDNNHMTYPTNYTQLPPYPAMNLSGQPMSTQPQFGSISEEHVEWYAQHQAYHSTHDAYGTPHFPPPDFPGSHNWRPT